VEILFLADRTGHAGRTIPASLTKVPSFGEREMPMEAAFLRHAGWPTANNRKQKAGLTPAFS
jgi:hypothetical protein